MKRFHLNLLVIGFLLFISTTSLAQVTIKCNSVYPKDSLAVKGIFAFSEKVKQYTNGNLVIEVHPGGVLGFKGPELLSVVKEGTVPMSDILMGVVQDSEKIFGLPFLPRIVTNYEDALNYYNTAKPLYEKAAERWNQKLLYVSPWPPTGLFLKQEVKSIGDLKNMRIRVYDKNIEKLFTIMGSNPIMMAWVDVPNAVKSGTLDGVLTTAGVGLGANLNESFKFFMPLNLDIPLNMVTINLKTWNALSQDQKNAIEKAAQEVQDSQWQMSKTDNAEAVKNLIAKGVIISVGGGANSENRHGIKVMAEGGVLLTLDKSFQAELDIVSKKVIDDFAAVSGGEIAGLIKSFTSSKKQ